MFNYGNKIDSDLFSVESLSAMNGEDSEDAGVGFSFLAMAAGAKVLRMTLGSNHDQNLMPSTVSVVRRSKRNQSP